MIDFTKNNSHLWQILQSFPIYWTLLGKSYRAYDRDTINLNDPMYYKIEFPTDRNVILYMRQLDTQEQLLTYRVLIGGSDSGGEVDPVTIFNNNPFFQSSKPSGLTITKDVTLAGQQTEVDYAVVYGSDISGSRSSGGLSLDGFPRIYEAGHPPVYVEINTDQDASDQNYRLEFQWVEA